MRHFKSRSISFVGGALVVSGFAFITACGDDDSGTTPSSEERNYLGAYNLMDLEFGTSVTVTVEDGERVIESNSLPDHDTGEFPNAGNPNTISEQALSYAFPVEPTFTGEANFSQTAGVAINGVPFEPGTGESVACGSGENYRIEALQDVYNLGLDFNNAHVQPTGKYHYHGISLLLVEAYQKDIDLVHVGFAADGYLMYYSKSGAYRSSYALASETRSGSECVPSGPNGTAFELDGSVPDGTYTSDWVFVDGSGDLDSCNGITIDGEYAYIVTDEFPYVSRCLNGEFSGAGGPPQGGAGGLPPQGGRAPNLSGAAADLGVSETALIEALGNPPFDLNAAAAALEIEVAALEAALPTPQGPPPGGNG